MESAAFILFALWLKSDRRKAALVLCLFNVIQFVLFSKIESDFLYYFTAASADACLAYYLAGLGTKTSHHLCLSSVASCVLNGIGYLWYLAYMPVMPYNIAITLILVIQMAILLRAGIYDTGHAVCNINGRVDLRNRVLGAFKSKTVQS
jgi:hypothetical protein